MFNINYDARLHKSNIFSIYTYLHLFLVIFSTVQLVLIIQMRYVPYFLFSYMGTIYSRTLLGISIRYFMALSVYSYFIFVIHYGSKVMSMRQSYQISLYNSSLIWPSSAYIPYYPFSPKIARKYYVGSLFPAGVSN